MKTCITKNSMTRLTEVLISWHSCFGFKRFNLSVVFPLNIFIRFSYPVKPILCVTVLMMYQVVLECFAAGSDTTATTLEWAALYMITNPDVQEKCYKEIRKVDHYEFSVSLSLSLFP